MRAGHPLPGHSDAQTDSPLPPQITDLTMELSDERYKGDVACQVLDGERAERLRGARELQELQVGEPRAIGLPSPHSLAGPKGLGLGKAAPFLPQSKHDQVQKKLESVEKQLEEAQQLVQLREMKISGSGGGKDVPSGAIHPA